MADVRYTPKALVAKQAIDAERYRLLGDRSPEAEARRLELNELDIELWKDEDLRSKPMHA